MAAPGEALEFPRRWAVRLLARWWLRWALAAALFVLLLVLPRMPGAVGRWGQAAATWVMQHDVDLNGAEAAASRWLRWASSATSKPPSLGPLIRPVDGPVAAAYGWRTRNGRREFHTGIDFTVTGGLPVRAAAAGLAVSEGIDPAFGLTVRLSHAGGWETVYAHCGQVLVRPGTRIGQGAPVCLTSGAQGPEGSVLHFQLHKDGRPVDPTPQLGLGGH